MENWKTALALIGTGVIIGVFVILGLLFSGLMPNKIGVAGIEFAIPTPTPKVVVTVVTATPMPSPTPTPLSNVWTEIKAIIDAETEATRNRDLEAVLSLYADNAAVFESFSGTRWGGKDEIRSRYSGLFARSRFIENFHELIDLKPDSPDNPINVTVKVRQRARVQDVTSGNVTNTLSSQELWYFTKTDGTWKIIRFIYGMPD